MNNIENLGKQWVDEIVSDLQKRRKRLASSLASLTKTGNYADAHSEAITVLDRAISAALAASGGNAAPGLTDERIVELSEDHIGAYGIKPVEFARAIEAASAPNAALVAALQNLLHLADKFGIQSGVCCCGDDMKRHSNPMYCGHSPVDSGEYYTASAIEEARMALSAAGQEVGHG